MSLKSLFCIAGVASLLGWSADAADLESMSRAQKRIYCVAYGLIDAYRMKTAGVISEREYARTRIQLAWKIQNKGDNYNYSRDFRRLEMAMEEIIDEDPSVQEIATKGAECRVYLRM